MSALFHVDWRNWLPEQGLRRIDHIITDIPYGDELDPWNLLSWIPAGNLITFEKPNRLFSIQPDHVYYWIKPSLPKNTVNSLADPVEWIYVWQRGVYRGPKVSKMQSGNYNTVRYDLIEGEQVSPYQKPLSLMLWLLELHTCPGDVVLDICAGRAVTTLRACDMLGRKGIGCEINQDDYEFGKRRLAA